jgi:uncharacterized protein (DUF697 family)/GTP-binding protein EngB required for normal cell division
MDEFNQYTEFVNMEETFNIETDELDLEKARENAIKSKEKISVLVAGLTGVGKSTLVNAVFGSEVVKTGMGKPVTQHLEKIEVPEKGLLLWDTKGIEAKNYESTLAQLEDDIANQMESSLFPHVAWVLVSSVSRRIQEADLALIEILKEKKIPTAVIFTNVYGKVEREFVEEAIAVIDEKEKEWLDGAYVSVNSIPYEISDEITIPANLGNLIEVTTDLFPKGKENAKLAFAKAQRVDNELRLEAMKSGARKIVHYGAAAAAGVGASPIPGSDAPLIAAAQSTMIYKISTEFELDLPKSILTSTITGILGVTALAQVGRAVVANALKFIPGVGSLAGGAISATTAFSLTEAVGHAYIAVLAHYYNFETGNVELPSEATQIMETFKTVFSPKS